MRLEADGLLSPTMEKMAVQANAWAVIFGTSKRKTHRRP